MACYSYLQGRLTVSFTYHSDILSSLQLYINLIVIVKILCHTFFCLFGLVCFFSANTSTGNITRVFLGCWVFCSIFFFLNLHILLAICTHENYDIHHT